MEFMYQQLTRVQKMTARPAKYRCCVASHLTANPAYQSQIVYHFTKYERLPLR